MKIAVVGAGFSGLSITWHLLKMSDQIQIDLFDKRALTKGTSGASSGLVDPYPGKYTNQSLYADEALKETKKLIESVQIFSKKKIIQSVGLFKPALTQEIKDRYMSRCAKFKNLEWKTLFGYEGIFISEGFCVEPRYYLQALWQGCKEKGAVFIQKNVHLSELSSYDQVIYAGGYELDFLAPIVKLSVQTTKGQMLVCEKSDLDTNICAKGHISPVEDTTYLGSTYERNFMDDQNNLETSLCLKEQIGTFFPKAKHLKVLECRAGIRVKRKGHYLPFIGKVEKNIWMITGMGSRGLLYHAYLGKQLSLAMLNNENINPSFGS